jgi:hypothetical protein
MSGLPVRRGSPGEQEARGLGGRTPHTRGERRSECPVDGTLLVRRVGDGPLRRGAAVVTEVVQHLDDRPPARLGKSAR